MKSAPIIAVVLSLACLTFSGCSKTEGHSLEGEHEAEARKIVVTTPSEQQVVVTEPYVCQIHSRRHIEVRALEGGYLEEIPVREGQEVKQGELMFKIVPTLYQARLDSEVAEAQLAQIEFNNTKKLFEQNVVSDKEVALAQAKLGKALAQMKLAQAELNFTDVKAPFDGIIDRLYQQQGSLIEEGDMLTTLSDNAVMWVYFNVPEARYLEYKAGLDRGNQTGSVDPQGDDVDDRSGLELELRLADSSLLGQPGKIAAIEADFNNETGNIAFRADFANPDRLLRHGQTGTVLIHRTLDNAIVIPQRSTFEILAKKYVFIVDKDNVVHQHEIKIKDELEDIYVIDGNLTKDDRIVLEGVQQVQDGDKVEFEFKKPSEVLKNLKYTAE